MIYINLIAKKKKKRIPKILGIEVSEINFKMLIIVYLISLTPDYFYFPKLEEEIVANEEKVQQLRNKERQLRTFLRKNQNVQEKLSAYNDQVEKLRLRSGQVDAIIKKRTNPKSLLEKLARGIPSDLWLDELRITSDRMLYLKGAALEYKHIGDFISISNESRFYGNSLNLKSSETKPERVQGTEFRFLVFEIEGNIETFDPWSE